MTDTEGMKKKAWDFVEQKGFAHLFGALPWIELAAAFGQSVVDEATTHYKAWFEAEKDRANKAAEDLVVAHGIVTSLQRDRESLLLRLAEAQQHIEVLQGRGHPTVLERARLVGQVVEAARTQRPVLRG